MRFITFISIALICLGGSIQAILAEEGNSALFLHVRASSKFERTALVNAGLSIEITRSDSVYGTASKEVVRRLKNSGVKILEEIALDDVSRLLDFPSEDTKFHNFSEMTAELTQLAQAHPDFLRLFSIGKTIQGRDIWALQFNSSKAVMSETPGDVISVKPGIVFMGNHHAREHVSAEVPLLLAQHLANNYATNAEIKRLVDTRDIYIIPMINPDGVEYDVATGSYRWQRKNMRRNSNGTTGVDLNRNYGYQWGTGGSSKDPSSDVYMGPNAFSEPESQAVKDFVDARPNLKILLSFHTFSELILYPWGHSYEKIPNTLDQQIYSTMAQKMASWNGYKPEQSSELYIASGDTTDWSYGVHGIYSFTFELSPKDLWNGGFYPGQSMIDPVFQANLKPALYLIDLADDPKRSLMKADSFTSYLE